MATKKKVKKAVKNTSTKKNVAKKAIKKPATKKKITKTAAKRKVARKTGSKTAKSKVTITVRDQILGDAPVEHQFVVRDGSKLKSVQELADALEHMSEDVFRHHVGSMHNDFATWVQDIFADPDFANDLRRVQNRIETRIKVLQRLVDAVIAEAKKNKR